MKKHTVVIKNNEKILIAYLKEDMNLSSRKAKSLLKDGFIKLNDKKAYGDSRIKSGDVLYIYEKEKRGDNIIPQEMPLSILCEDEFMMAVDKPPGMPVHPTGENNKDTLANGIRYYFDMKDIHEPVRFYNRLDMNTSGIVLIPKDAQTHSLIDRVSSNTMMKKYLAIVMGVPEEKKGIIVKPLSAHADDEGRRYISDEGKHAITEYEVVEVYPSASLLNVCIKTGRTHQIRIHLSSIGHPIIGDSLYGGCTSLIGRQALHASLLKFLHPVNNRYITINSPLPKDMEQLIKILKGETKIERL